MKRFAVIALCAALLCGCAPATDPTTPPETVATVPSAPVQTDPPTEAVTDPPTEPAETVPPATDPAMPYTVDLHAAVCIFSEPSYDEDYLGIVEVDARYTIVEEAQDWEGNRWGRLKSGAGWVDLTALEKTGPVTVAYADETLRISGNYHPYTGETSDYITQIVFRAREVLTDVELYLLEPDWERSEGYTVEQVLYTLPALEPEMPLMAEVAFWGDLTAYGLSFTDESGARRHFAVTVSGRNGILELTEYLPANEE